MLLWPGTATSPSGVMARATQKNCLISLRRNQNTGGNSKLPQHKHKPHSYGAKRSDKKIQP